MKKIKVLNLYAGIGGNRKLWENVEVTAVEINPKIAKVYQQNFPNDKIIIGDAHAYLLEHFEEFDFIWSSPPCQSHSKMVKATRHKIRKYPDMKLYEEIIFLKNFFKGLWVVENVKPYYEPLIEAQTVGRHLFWANFKIPEIEIKSRKNFIENCNASVAEEMKKEYGIHYEGNIYYENNNCPGQILRNAVNPKIGAHVFLHAWEKETKPLMKWIQ